MFVGACLWSTLRSLTHALHLKTLGLKDLDIVASELVKFLLLNTGYDSIESLEKRVSEMESAQAEIKKNSKGATTSASTASNKVDELNRELKAMEKRLVKVEGKVQ